MKNLNPHSFTSPFSSNPATTGLPLCSDGVFFMEKPKLIEDLGMIYATPNSKQKAHFGIYECPYCGIEFKSVQHHIKDGTTKSCGCYAKQVAAELLRTNHIAKTHGLTNHPLYKLFKHMCGRCYNPNEEHYKDYGGRGIGICYEWRKSPELFVIWGLEHGYQKGLQIDRRDNDKDYSPDNCRWVTRSINAQNKRLIPRNNTSGYRGVSWHKRNHKWAMQIAVNGVKYAEYFDIKEDAAQRYNDIVKENKSEHPSNILPSWYQEKRQIKH